MIVYLKRTAAKTAALAAAAIMIFGGTGPAWAQNAAGDETAERLLACDSISDMSEKLACFDSVVKGLKDSPAEPQPEAESPSATAADPVVPTSVEPAPPPAAPAASSAEASAAAAIAAPAAATATTTTSTAAPSAAAAPEAAAGEVASLPDEPPVAPTGAPVDPVDDFGRDSMKSVAEKEPEEEEAAEEKLTQTMHATVVRSWINNDGRFSVELDNGQIWRETEASRTRFQGDNDMVFGTPKSSTGRLPKEGRTVEISEGRMSGYRMKTEGIRQAAWVRRTK